MGVKQFTEVFADSGICKYKELYGKNVVIDTSVEIHRAMLGIKNTMQLTDSEGNPTIHINVILLTILKLKMYNINQYWIFDHSGVKHNPIKEQELIKRQKRKAEALAKAEAIRDKDVLFSSDEEDLQKYDKMAFSVKSNDFNDVKYLLSQLDVPWIEAPKGVEAEHLCSICTRDASVFGVTMDYVLSPDTDALLFGATKVLKRSKKLKEKFYVYNLEDILSRDYAIKNGTVNIDYDDLIKICVILGTDFADKSKRVGPKTVMAKFQTIELTDEQKKAVEYIKMPVNLADIDRSNAMNQPFSNVDKYAELLEWLYLVKGFNIGRIKSRVEKIPALEAFWEVTIPSLEGAGDDEKED